MHARPQFHHKRVVGGGGVVPPDLDLDSLTLNGFTEGSVLFVGPAGLVSEDNANLFWENTANQLRLGGSFALGASSAAPDVVLTRDAANILAQRNGTNAQRARVYNTFTDASNYERATFGWESNALFIGTEQAGTGVARNMALRTVGAGDIAFYTNNTHRWSVEDTGHILAAVDDTYDIGALNATRPKDIYVSETFFAGNSPLVGGAGFNEVFSGNHSVAGECTQFVVSNMDNTNANSVAALSVITGGSSAGDPLYAIGVQGQTFGGIGMDNSDNDTIKIQTSGVGPTGMVGTTAVSFPHVASANRNVTIAGSNGGNPTIATTAGDLAITPNTIIAGNLTVNGNTSLGDASTDTLTIAPNAVTWTNNPTHSGNHIFSGDLTIQGNSQFGNASTDTTTAAGTVVANMGSGSGQCTLIGRATTITTNVGNVGTGEDDLMTYSLPANALSANAKGVRITAWGISANNAAAKALRIYFGSVAMLLVNLTTNVAHTWKFVAEVFRTGSNAQDYMVLLSGTASSASSGTLTQTDTSAITIKCTGAATNNNDIVQHGMLVEFLG